MKSCVNKFWDKALGNNDQIVTLAKHALDEMRKNFEAAVLAEREACAKVCDKYAEESSNPMNFAENCAAAIRARSNK